MLISMKHKFVFLCMPKCASKSIEAALRPFSDISITAPPYFRHTNYRRYETYLRPYIENGRRTDKFETICVIREPLSWLYSHYRFRTRLPIRNESHPKHSVATHRISFSEFVEAYMSRERPSFANVGSQFSFVKNANNEIGVEKVFLYENLERFTQYMSRKLGRALKVGRMNVSPRRRHESDLMELADYTLRKIVDRFGSTRSFDTQSVEYGLTERQEACLRTFLNDDFDLYEEIKGAESIHA